MNTTQEKDLEGLAVDLVGKPYVKGGYDLQGFDCWGLVHYVYQNYLDIELEKYPNTDPFNTVRVSSLINSGSQASNWINLEKPESLCVVAMSKSKILHHVGIWLDIGEGYCIHAFDGTHVIMNTAQQLRLQGFHKILYFKYDS